MNDMASYIQIVLIIISFFGLMWKLKDENSKTLSELLDKINALETKLVPRIAIAENNIQHIMHKMDMEVRKVDKQS